MSCLCVECVNVTKSLQLDVTKSITPKKLERVMDHFDMESTYNSLKHKQFTEAGRKHSNWLAFGILWAWFIFMVWILK